MPRTSYRALVAAALLAGLFASACKSAGEAALDEAAQRTPGLRVEFEGGGTFTRTELLNALAEDLRELSSDGIDRPDVDDLAYALEIFHRTRGFPDAYVSYELTEGERLDEAGASKPPAARFRIDEGRRARIGTFELTGNEANADPALSDERLRSFFSPPAGLFNEEPWWFVRARLESGRGALRDFYLAKGYLSAEVDEVAIEWLDAAETSARVVIRIQEGPRWVLAETLLEVPPDFPDKRRRALEKELEQGSRDTAGQRLPYTLRLAYGLRARLLEQFGQWGHPDAACSITEVELGEGRMQVRFEVTPGPLIRLGEVFVAGNEKTRSSFVKKRLTLEEGQIVDSRKLRTSFSRLFETGLFSTVSFALKRGSEEASAAREVKRDLLVEVLELPSIELTLEPGYGSYEGPRLRLGIEDANVLGTGRTAKLETTVGALAQKVSLGFGERALFDSDYAGSAAIYYDRREEPSFTLQEQGFAASVSRSWDEDSLEASLGYRFRLTEATDIEFVDDVVEKTLADVDISSIALTLARDTRNGFFTPTAGSFLRAQLEWASAVLGSEVDFLSARLEGAVFHALPWEGGVLGTGFETGLITPVGDTEVIPLQVRMFNGGENTVRSFREDELGNLDTNGEPIGGEAYSVASLELRQRIAGPLSGALFYDVGNLEPDHEQYLDFDEMRQALGLGLRYALPIGPIRLDAGWNPTAEDGEDDWVVHLSVGMSF